MFRRYRPRLNRARLHRILVGPQLLAFFPALTLGGYWFGGEAALLALAVVLPGLFALAAGRQAHAPGDAIDPVTKLPLRAALIATLDQIFAQNHQGTACIVVEIDDYPHLARHHGPAAADEILRGAAGRVVGALRTDDLVARLDGACLAIALAPTRRADLESLIQLAARLQAAIAAPISLGGTRVHVTASVGFCLPARAREQNGNSYLEAALRALAEARGVGPGAIRAYANGTAPTCPNPARFAAEIADALENGQIRAWFQPQVSTDTGKLSGLEALARWVHPVNGLIAPIDFLPAIREAGLFERLGEIILSQSLRALKRWDNAGLIVPCVGVNFSSFELGNPGICDKIRWELDRFDLTPDRLTVEILEDVIAATDNDMIARNIRALSDMGCNIDLDDFGTGHASIANIRRFAINRIKIDRSYVTRADTDREQQKMVAAILTMAERLDLQSLAEGVETMSEYSILAQLGCNHVQGFAIGRPMAEDDISGWMARHRETIVEPPQVTRRAI